MNKLLTIDLQLNIGPDAFPYTGNAFDVEVIYELSGHNPLDIEPIEMHWGNVNLTPLLESKKLTDAIATAIYEHDLNEYLHTYRDRRTARVDLG